ncbi:MAG: type II toxin-antitoxin system prevent-host-death family antitoxin [Caldilineaceae bacterium]
MMHKLPQMTSIAELRNNHLQVFARLEKGPVVINNRSQPVGVLLSPAAWDRLMERLEDQEDIIDALQMKLDIARGEVEMETITATEIEEWIKADEPVPA